MYSTVSLYEASYLICEGHQISGREFEDNGKVAVLFESTPLLEKRILKYHNKGEKIKNF